MELNMIKQMERYARTNPDVISLGQGIPAGSAHQKIQQSVAQALTSAKDIDRYSDPAGLFELRSKISSNLSYSGINYSQNEIIVTCGAIEAINSTLLSLVTNEKNEVIIPTPTYSAYKRAVKVANGTTVSVQLNESLGWILEVSDIERSITPNTAALLLCNPNNPTGSIYRKQTLRQLCELALKHNFVIIIDEVYGNMLYTGEPLYTPAIEQKYRNHIVRVVSFSKDFNLTGWRIGYLHSSEQLIERILPVHDTLVNCAPVVSQYAAITALDIAPEVISSNSATYHTHRLLMQDCLEAMSAWLSYQPVHGGYFLFPRLLVPVSSTDFCIGLAQKARLVAVPGADFGQGGEQHIRLCFGRSKIDIIAGMQRLQKYLEKTYGSVHTKQYKERYEPAVN